MLKRETTIDSRDWLKNMIARQWFVSLPMQFGVEGCLIEPIGGCATSKSLGISTFQTLQLKGNQTNLQEQVNRLQEQVNRLQEQVNRLQEHVTNLESTLASLSDIVQRQETRNELDHVNEDDAGNE
ncbi:hypothetical protein TrVFT333_009692 [Trichoderma virens FT-333]|nr:hypothetical protein TrVFT333_009692 [Trichoderma virens FT-333]